MTQRTTLLSAKKDRGLRQTAVIVMCAQTVLPRRPNIEDYLPMPFSLKYFSAPGWNGIGERS